MNTRTQTIASFFSVAMAAMLLGAVVTTQIHRPETALARTAEPALAQSAPTVPRHVGPVTLDTFRDVARLQTPGVVNVSTTKKVATRQRGGGGQDPFRDFFGDDLMDRFFGGPQGQGGPDFQSQRSLGSGFVVDKDGYILTNRHVVEGADKISVTMADGKRYDAKLVGKDARTDVALLKIEAKGNLTVLNLGDSDQTDVGEWVMAVGNPFGLSGNSVTVGVVSFKGRPLPLNTQANPVEMIQTDASINPGNSGGPLLNTRGEVIGINTLIITQGPPQSAGVGFAVPINVAKEILPQLRDKGHVVRGWLGVVIQPVSEDMAKSLHMEDAKGAIVADVTKDSPAEKAGLKPGDVVLSADGRAIEDSSALSRYIASKAPGSSVRLQVVRDGSQRTVSLTLGTFPDEAERDESSPSRGDKLGMTLRDLNPSAVDHLQLPRGTTGVVVMGVEAGEAAEDAGLQRGDVIVSVNGQDVQDVASFDREIAKAKPDGVARLRVRRGNSHQFLILKLG
jgi:serine protease Do